MPLHQLVEELVGGFLRGLLEALHFTLTICGVPPITNNNCTKYLALQKELSLLDIDAFVRNTRDFQQYSMSCHYLINRLMISPADNSIKNFSIRCFDFGLAAAGDSPEIL